MAEALRESLKKHYPNLDFTVLVTDRCDSEKRKAASRLPARVLFADDLGIPFLDLLREWYCSFEVCNILRPYLIRHLMKKWKAGKVIYLDADIYVTNRFDEVEKKLDRHFCALTPHVLKPYPLDNQIPNDLSLLNYGIYNSGFQAFRNHRKSFNVLEWLFPRLLLYGFNDPPYLFVDQKFLPLAEALFPDTFCRVEHPGYNIAYWNLHERAIRRIKNRYTANGQDAIFFHFSGYNPAHPREWTQRGKKKDPVQPGNRTGAMRVPQKDSLRALNHVLEEYGNLLKECFARFPEKVEKKTASAKRGKSKERFYRQIYPKLVRQIKVLKY